MTLALSASGHWTDTHAVPFWVKISAARDRLGTYLGGWRIIRTLGKGPGRHHAPPRHGQ